MKKGCKFAVLLLAGGALVLQPLLAMAGTGARLIPNGSVSLLKDGNQVTQFNSEMPLPDGLLTVSRGSCVVQSSGIQLVAQNKTVFGMSESFDRWNVTVNSGRVDFALRGDSKLVTFNTPHDTIRAENFIVPASSDGLVKGYLLVTDKGTEIRMDDGGLQVATAEGARTVQAPSAMVLSSVKTSQAVTSGGTSPTVASGQYMSFTCCWPWLVGGIVAGGGIGAGIYALATDDDEDDEVNGGFFQRGDDEERRGGIFFNRRGLPRIIPLALVLTDPLHIIPGQQPLERSPFRPT